MTLYFHETLDPVRQPGAHTRYLDELGKVVRTEGNARGSAGSACIAAWVPVFLTGAWPQIVTLWEMPGGWDGFAGHFDSTPALFHEPLERWYGERSGGFDRVLVGTDYTPNRAAMIASGRRAPVVLQQIVSLASGGASAYLQRLGDMREPIDASGQFSLLGAYEVAFRNGSEAVVLWSFPDMRTLSRMQARPDDVPAYAEWVRESQRLERTHVGLVLRPTDWSYVR
ncbi:MAG TPA: hypothetical protein VJR58_13425 [Vineibacter sp.]|nr:hypothetical protein [Vineibacter sp.]